MPTAKTYSYALLGKKANRARLSGHLLLRHSHEIIATDPVQVCCERQFLMDLHVVDWLASYYRTVHKPRKHEDNPMSSSDNRLVPCIWWNRSPS